MEEKTLVGGNFSPVSERKSPAKPTKYSTTTVQYHDTQQQLTKTTDPSSTFADLGLAKWAVETCIELGMRRPTPVQHHCIPPILAGNDVLGLAQTGSGKTAAFALPILHRLAEDPFGVFVLVVTPTRELAYQLAEQFRAFGSCLHLRCAVVVGGMNMINQVQILMQRPHVVIATPGRIKVLLEGNPDIPAVFTKTKELPPSKFITG